MANNKNNMVQKQAGNVAQRTATVDVAQEIAEIGLPADDAERLAELANDAISALPAERAQKIAKITEKMKTRPRATSRARVCAGFLIRYVSLGTCRAAAADMGQDINAIWPDIMEGFRQYPILRAVYEIAQDGRDSRISAKAADVVEDALDGREITRAQERIAPMALERLERAKWAPDRGGNGTRQADAKAAPAAVVINIQSGDAFKKCCDLLQTDQSNIIDV